MYSWLGASPSLKQFRPSRSTRSPCRCPTAASRWSCASRHPCRATPFRSCCCPTAAAARTICSRRTDSRPSSTSTPATDWPSSSRPPQFPRRRARPGQGRPRSPAVLAIADRRLHVHPRQSGRHRGPGTGRRRTARPGTHRRRRSLRRRQHRQHAARRSGHRSGRRRRPRPS
jgi:hypothetical protein